MSSPADTGRSRLALAFAALALAGIAFSLLQSVVAPALPEIQRELDTSTTTATWIFTAYLLSGAVCTPVLGRLGDMFGKQRVLIIALGLLALGTLISALASSVELIIVGRVVQGAGGAIFPLAFGIVRDEFPREHVAVGIGVLSGLLAVGGAAGILLAGPIVDGLSYHWLFWIPFVLVLLAILGTVLFVPESPVRMPGRINWWGAVLLTGWLLCLLLGISEASSWGWTDARTLGLIAAAAVLAAAWILVEHRATEPLIDMDMMRQRGVWTINLAGFLVGAGMYTSFILLPQFVETPASAGFGFGATVTEAGLFLLPSTIIVALAGPFTGRLAMRHGARLPLILGALGMAAGFLFLAVAHDERWHIYVASSILGAGTGLAFSSLANAIVECVRAEQTGAATGMNTVLRIIGGSIGSTIGASILAGSVVAATGLPTESAFTTTFLLCAGGCALGALVSLAAPRRVPATAAAVAA